MRSTLETDTAYIFWLPAPVFTAVPHEAVARPTQVKLHGQPRQFYIARFGRDREVFVVIQALLQCGTVT